MCYVRGCKGYATTWIERSEFYQGQHRSVEAKVCDTHAKTYTKAANQND